MQIIVDQKAVFDTVRDFIRMEDGYNADILIAAGAEILDCSEDHFMEQMDMEQETESAFMESGTVAKAIHRVMDTEDEDNTDLLISFGAAILDSSEEHFVELLNLVQEGQDGD